MRNKKNGFTLLELMIAAAIVIVCLVGLLSTYITCLELIETTKNSNLALNAEQKVLEEIRSATFSGIPAAYDGYTFSVAGMSSGSSIGRAAVSNANSSLLNVTIGVCWSQKGSRIIGECQNSSGTLTFSDTNGNNILDSPVQLTTLMAQR